MCGIAGIVKYNLDKNRYAQLAGLMVQTIIHRGPDDHAVYTSDDYCFGHARLSIVDLAGGKQPMTEAKSKNTIVFNGEIYGYKQLKLQYEDYSFNTLSDTELLLAMYSRKAEGMLDELPGMFAFSIWDDSRKTLFAARDRFGEKPFYYAIGKKGEFVFASEMKAILKSGLVNPVLDVESVDFYLRRLYVYPAKTIFKNVYTLPPGHALKFTNGEVHVWKYWRMPEQNEQITFSEAKSEFVRLLDKSVASQLVADVPVAAFLSGGLDSSTVVAMASKYKRNLTTFSFGFEGDRSELKYANQIASKYNTNHIILEEKAFDIAELLIKMHFVYDEPFADSSNIPTFLISKLASKYVKVVLTGDGCDELMAGYNFWYRRLYEYDKAKNKTKIAYFYALLMRSFCYRFKLHKHWYYHDQVQGFNDREKHVSISEIYQEQRNFFDDAQIKRLLINYPSAKYSESGLNALRDIFNEDLRNYMPGDILVKTDRASMANSIELRTPFLDKNFAEFCISLPNKFKITDNQEKYLLRETCGSLWSEDIRKRNKQGFAAIVGPWLKQSSIIDLKEKYLKNKSSKLFLILHFDEVMKYYHQDDIRTWALLNLAMWADKWEFAISE